MKTSGRIDWIAATYPHDYNEELLVKFVGKWKSQGIGPHGYERRAISETGAFMFADGPKEMGKHIIMSGSALEEMRLNELSDVDILIHMWNHKAKPSRVDMAVDMLNGQLSVTELWDAYRAGECATKARWDKRFTAEQGTDDGFYLGARTSDKSMRIYNKGRQLGVDYPWVRVELETHKRYSVAVVQQLRSKDELRRGMNAMIKAFADFSQPEWIEAFNDCDEEVPVLPRKSPNFWSWIQNQVAPAIAARQSEYPDERTIALLMRFIKEAEEKAKGKRK